MIDTKFYVYIHYRKTDKIPFYVGKGSANRDTDASGRNAYWNRVAARHGVYSEIYFEDIDEATAFLIEKEVILELRSLGYPLTNMTDGGEGSSGLVFTDIQRLNIATGLRKRIPWNKGTALLRTEYKISRESRDKMRAKKLGMFKGELNGFSDKKTYSFVRLLDGFTISCTRSYLCKEYGVLCSDIKKLFYKTSPRKSAGGWRLVTT